MAAMPEVGRFLPGALRQARAARALTPCLPGALRACLLTPLWVGA